MPPGVRHYQNVANSNAWHQPSKENAFVDSTVANRQVPQQNKAESAVQQQKLSTVGKHERNVGYGLRSWGNLEI